MSDPSLARVPLLPRGVRLHDDRVRGVPVLLAPERALLLDPIGHAILAALDGVCSIGMIAQRLAARYGAPEGEVAADVATFIDDLAERQMVWFRHDR